MPGGRDWKYASACLSAFSARNVAASSTAFRRSCESRRVRCSSRALNATRPARFIRACFIRSLPQAIARTPRRCGTTSAAPVDPSTICGFKGASMRRSLAGTRVLVLGGSSGIGLATAKAAAAGGANVTLASRSSEKVNAAVAEVGHGAAGAPLDTTNDAALEAFFAKQPEWDHIVVSVAAGRSAGLHDLSLPHHYGNTNAKFWSAYKTARLARISPEGSLTLVSGFLSHRPNKDALLQGCINAALESLGRGLALALSPVRVNTVSPGLIDTP